MSFCPQIVIFMMSTCHRVKTWKNSRNNGDLCGMPWVRYDISSLLNSGILLRIWIDSHVPITPYRLLSCDNDWSPSFSTQLLYVNRYFYHVTVKTMVHWHEDSKIFLPLRYSIVLYYSLVIINFLEENCPSWLRNSSMNGIHWYVEWLTRWSSRIKDQVRIYTSQDPFSHILLLIWNMNFINPPPLFHCFISPTYGYLPRSITRDHRYG